jgi:hypothetical protein
MTNRFKGLFFCLIALSAIFLFLQDKVLAAMSLTFSGVPSSVEEESPFEVDVSLVDAPINRIYYLRAAFHKEGETQYFGYTFNNEGNWHNSPGEYTKFLEITTNEEGSWSGKLEAKTDLADPAFEDAGNYSFKIGRYTEGGSLSWSNNSVTIAINVQPTPTPESEPEETPEPTPTPTPTPIPTLILTPTPTKKPTPTLIPTPTGEILGEEATPTPEEPTPTPTVLGEQTSNPVKFIPLVFIGLGSLLLLVSGGFILSPKLKMKYNHLRKSGEGEKII